MLFAKISPKILRAFYVSRIVVLLFLSEQTDYIANPRYLKPPTAPIQIVPIIPVVTEECRIRTKLSFNDLQGLDGPHPSTGLHCRAVERNLESVVGQLMHKLQVLFSQQGIGSKEQPTPLRTIDCPDRLGCPKAIASQTIIDGLDVLQRRIVRVVENREGKLLAVWKLHWKTGSQEADLAYIELTKETIEGITPRASITPLLPAHSIPDTH